MDPVTLTPRKLATMWGVTERTLRRWRRPKLVAPCGKCGHTFKAKEKECPSCGAMRPRKVKGKPAHEPLPAMYPGSKVIYEWADVKAWATRNGERVRDPEADE